MSYSVKPLKYLKQKNWSVSQTLASN